MGLSSSKQKTKSSSTATTTPQVPGHIAGPYKDYYSQVSALQQSNPTATTTPASTLQQRAFTAANGLPANRTADAQNATRSLLDYAPSTVTAGSLADADLSPYTDPWEDDVVNATLSDVERFRGMGINANSSNATLSGGWGGSVGSRAGVSDSLTNEAALREAASRAAALRSAGFINAQDRATSDIDRRFSADQFNVGSDMAGAGFRLGAAGQLGDQELAEGASSRADIGLMGDLGETERDIAMENNPQYAQMQYLARLAALLSAGNPELFTGQNIQQSGTSTTSSTPSGISQIGSLIQGLSSMFGKPG
jgi:hypothetical protein